MASTMSKRQQARNEKALQDLVHSVPGNNFCADCNARNPSWASWSLGIFLCMRCAAIHRKLGTHISKVKSLSMDGWTNEQVENMKRIGNEASNKIYNPQGKNPPVPIDVDEADSAMERFIRSKYVSTPSAPKQSTTLRSTTMPGARRQNTGSTISDEGTPPPLPPKTGGSFFKKSTKSGSSTFPLSFRSKKSPQLDDGFRSARDTPPRSPVRDRELRNKPSKVFGASLGQDSTDRTAEKLTQLRDMGFTDEKRNAMVLKGVNGSIEKAIETLVRLGEGGVTPISPPPRDTSLQTAITSSDSRSFSPAPATPSSAGLSGFPNSSPMANRSPAPSNNPWDVPPAQPVSSQSTGTMPSRNPFYAMTSTNTNNPFGVPAPQNDMALNQSMQNLSLAPPQQQLFPHHTGPAPQPLQQVTYQQAPVVPPVPQIPVQNYATPFAFTRSQTLPPMGLGLQPQQPQQQNYNPFLQTAAAPQPQQLSLSMPSAQQQNQAAYGNNPFARSPTRLTSPTMLGQIPEQSQQNFYSTPTSPIGNMGNNPFMAAMAQQQPQQQQQQYPQPFEQALYQPQQQQNQGTVPQPVFQQPQRVNNADIMALYGYSSIAPAQQQQQQQQQQQIQQPQQPQITAAYQQQATTRSPFQSAAPLTAAQRSISSPATMQVNNKNPFLNGGASSSPFASGPASNSTPISGGARSRESMTLGMEMAWNNGRHSPDAFASLSARSG